MNQMEDARIADALQRMTAPRAESGELWRKALDNTERVPAPKPITSGWRVSEWTLRHRLMGLAAAAVIVLSVASAFILSTSPRDGSVSLSSLRNFGDAHATYSEQWSRSQDGLTSGSDTSESWNQTLAQILIKNGSNEGPFVSAGGGGGGGGFVSGGVESPSRYTGESATAQDSPAQSPKPLGPTDRSVIRKATIALTSPDVRATFLRVSQVISDARGEFISQSALQGSGQDMQGDLTLRVAADRLDAVLNELRQLGTVVSEQSGGDDVTSHVVDLEARLRNESRIEAELLQLLESRNDAPLKEILELREQIGRVRGQIEQLTAQRQRLSNLVALATVLVIIRADDAPQEVQGGLGTYFMANLMSAWQDGVRALADAIGFIVSVLVGGIIWWTLLALIVIALRQTLKRQAAARLAAVSLDR